MPDRTPRPETEAIRAALRRLHPKIDTDAALDELTRGQTATRALSEMSLAALSSHLPPRTAELVHLIPGIARATLRNEYPAHPAITCFDDACRFLYGLFLGQRYEHCYLLLMKKNRYLIRDLLIQSGTLDSLPFYTRNIVEAVVAFEADALIIAHNHPGGNAAPSQADLESTALLMQALQPLSVPLLDHIILSGAQGVSIRQSGHIPEKIWLRQANNCPAFLKTWFDPPKPARKK